MEKFEKFEKCFSGRYSKFVPEEREFLYKVSTYCSLEDALEEMLKYRSEVYMGRRMLRLFGVC